MDQLPFPAAPPPVDLASRAVALRRSLEVARLLMASRTVDLSGFEDDVGRLCAGLLDLPTGEAAALRRELTALLAAVDATLACCPEPMPRAR